MKHYLFSRESPLICFFVKFHNDSIYKFSDPFDSWWFAIYLYTFLG